LSVIIWLIAIAIYIVGVHGGEGFRGRVLCMISCSRAEMVEVGARAEDWLTARLRRLVCFSKKGPRKAKRRRCSACDSRV
jgi:hypothetical protein